MPILMKGRLAGSLRTPYPLFTAIVLALAFLAAAATAPNARLRAQAPVLDIQPNDSLVLTIGQAARLTVLIGGRPATATRTALSWGSSAPEVAEFLDPAGIDDEPMPTVRALRPGRAVLTARWGDQEDRIVIIVRGADDPTQDDERDAAQEEEDPAPPIQDEQGDPQEEGESGTAGGDEPSSSGGTGITGGEAFARGIVPGLGQYSVGQPFRGALVTLGAAGAVAWGFLTTKTEVLCGIPSDNCPSEWVLDEQETNNLPIALAVAGGLTLLGAIDAALSAQKASDSEASEGTREVGSVDSSALGAAVSRLEVGYGLTGAVTVGWRWSLRR